MSGVTTPLVDVSTMHQVDDTAAVASAEDLVHHRALYDTRPGGWGRDLWFYLCNEHTLLGAFYAHKDHPYTRHQRMVVLVTAAVLALLMTSFSLYMSGISKLAYSFVVAPLVLNLTHWGLDQVGHCAMAQSPHRSDSEREALATASDLAMERVAPVVGVAAGTAGVALIIAAHGYTLMGVGTHWLQMQVVGWAWGFVMDTSQFAFRRRIELNSTDVADAPLA
ncbi:hypothetical protein MMPV_001707 [Pyropia vietnamensis]